VLRRLLPVLLVAAALGGCGEDEPTSVQAPTPEATAVVTEEPTPTETATGTPSPTATEQPAPEEQEGGAGDEEAARVPARFVVSSSGVEPPRVSIPAFLAIELIVVNRLDDQMIVRLVDEDPFPVAAGDTVRARLDGRRPGRYPISFGSAGDALLVTGAEPGP
jgi:hypothetical protein